MNVSQLGKEKVKNLYDTAYLPKDDVSPDFFVALQTKMSLICCAGKQGALAKFMSKRHLILSIVAMFMSQAASADPATTPPSGATPPAASQAPAAPTAAPQAPAAAATAPASKPDEESYSYVSGYSDGCASANLRYARQEHVKPNKDPKLYDSDADYHSGWDHGYRKCEDKVTPGGLSVPGNSVVM